MPNTVDLNASRVRRAQSGQFRIQSGSYTTKTRADGELGWRIELEPKGGRKVIEIHVGNFPKNSVGCILLGTGRSEGNGCAVTEGKKAMAALRDAYGKSNRAIELVIKDA